MNIVPQYGQESRTGDELMIANMLAAISNKDILARLSDEEYKMILQTIKNHIVLKSQMAYSVQEEFITRFENGRKFK